MKLNYNEFRYLCVKNRVREREPLASQVGKKCSNALAKRKHYYRRLKMGNSDWRSHRIVFSNFKSRKLISNPFLITIVCCFFVYRHSGKEGGFPFALHFLFLLNNVIRIPESPFALRQPPVDHSLQTAFGGAPRERPTRARQPPPVSPPKPCSHHNLPPPAAHPPATLQFNSCSLQFNSPSLRHQPSSAILRPSRAERPSTSGEAGHERCPGEPAQQQLPECR